MVKSSSGSLRKCPKYDGTNFILFETFEAERPTNNANNPLASAKGKKKIFFS